MIILQICLFIFITGFYFFSLRICSPEGWIQAKNLAFLTGIYIFMFIVVVLWLGVYEVWILRVGIAISILFGSLLWSFPFLFPKEANDLRIKK
jgi:hypothetical protein